ELTSRSRPSRWAVAQRAGVDLAIVAFAVLAWFQLRQYSSPLAGVGGAIGIDPLLAAAPTLGVLAGAVIALRLLPPATRIAERLVDRRTWTATMLGMWQAGRRPHAGPVLLLALAVAVSTLAWCLASTTQQSLRDQADHAVGADLSLTQTGGAATLQRAREVAGLPGATAVLPVWRDRLRLGPEQVPADLVAVDAAAAAPVVRYRPDLVDGDDLFRRLAPSGGTAPAVELSANTRRLIGEFGVGGDGPTWISTAFETYAVIGDRNGFSLRLRLGTAYAGGSPVRFAVDLPGPAGTPLRLVGFEVATDRGHGVRYDWHLRGLTSVDGTGRGEPVDLSAGDWRVVAGDSLSDGKPALAGRGSIAASYELPAAANNLAGAAIRFELSTDPSTEPVPAAATPAALRALHIGVGSTTRLNVGGGQVYVHIVGEVAAVPGTSGPAAVLTDLPALAAVLNRADRQPAIGEWWVATDPARHGTAAAAAAALNGVTVRDRVATAASAGRDPYGLGGRAGLFAAALGATLLALVGLAVDARATARRRVGELAVLHTLGAGPRLLARALIAEQTFLAGLGVAVGLAVGVGVAATIAPLVILTPAADRPVPAPLLEVAWLPVTTTAAGVLAAALGMSALIATTMRQRLAAAQLRIGADQ
ncbi:MAG TPA: FtsX-like permease family protein, partial [Pilimelia sp.]|nr:FtsX-like permease family protein [Pilimelia sp.]